MTQDDIVLIEKIFKKSINSAPFNVEDRTFIDMLKAREVRRVEKEKRKAVLIQKIKGNVIGWFIISVLGSVGTMTYHYFTGK